MSSFIFQTLENSSFDGISCFPPEWTKQALQLGFYTSFDLKLCGLPSYRFQGLQKSRSLRHILCKSKFVFFSFCASFFSWRKPRSTLMLQKNIIFHCLDGKRIDDYHVSEEEDLLLASLKSHKNPKLGVAFKIYTFMTKLVLFADCAESRDIFLAYVVKFGRKRPFPWSVG